MSEETKQTPVEAAQPAASNTAGDGARGGGMMDGLGAGDQRQRGRKRRKVSYLTINKIETVDYKDVNTLRRFINEHGKILNTKVTGNTAKQQRMIGRAIRRAREMALLPFVVREVSNERPMRARGPRPDRDFRDRDNRDRDRAPSAEQKA